MNGKRSSDRYRLPQQFRTPPSDKAENWRSAFKRDHSACHDGGPRGCGLQPNTVLTFGSDGSTRLGYPGEGH